ncbi:MAG: RNA 2',3'-cyclic phosphodiesterase [Anaerolineae bacterium]
MPRLFVAIDLPDDLKQRIARLQAEIPTARWVKPEHMHLTLRFIGDEVPTAKIAPINTALAAVEAAPFTLTIAGVGRFPPSLKKAPRVLWVGLEPQPALQALHAQIEAALEGAGFAPEGRSYNPHITLARLNLHKPTPAADAFLEEQASFNAGTFTAHQFTLYNSLLTPQGPRYTHEAIYPMKKDL